MNIQEALETMKAQKVLGRTPSGRPLTEFAIEAMSAAISDEKNYGVPAVKCLSCCIIQSSLLVASGCSFCNSKDITNEINENDILKGVTK